MLPQRHRLRSSRDFSAVMRRGASPRNRPARAGTPLLVLHRGGTRQADAQAPARVGFIVSKAVGHAVVRNQVARRLRALMAERIEDLPRATDVVIRANPAAAGATSADLGAALDLALSRVIRRGEEPVGGELRHR